jgi:hypothetical protein
VPVGVYVWVLDVVSATEPLLDKLGDGDIDSAPLELPEGVAVPVALDVVVYEPVEDGEFVAPPLALMEGVAEGLLLIVAV